MKKFLSFLLLILSFNACVFGADVKILHTSDIHGRISPIEYNNTQDMGGYARRVYFAKQLKNQNKNVLLLDSGDYFQGSIYYRLDNGKAIAKLMPKMKYDAVAIGNHELDNGTKVLKRNIKLSKTQFISSNVHFDDKYLQKHVKPYIIKKIEGEKFLIIGATTQELKSLSNTNAMSVTDPSIEIRKIISNVDYDKLILVSHCGIDEDIEIANNVPEIDLILGGHNHLFFDKPKEVNNVPIIQDGEFGVRVGLFDFDEKVKAFNIQNIDNSIPSDISVEKAIKKLDKHNQKISNNIVGTADTTLIGEQNIIEQQQTNLGRLVLISMTKPFGNDFDGVFTNSGSIRINKNIKGNISYADVLEILPFENDTVMVEIKGKDLKTAIDFGLKTGERKYPQYYLKDKNIDNEKTYKIITNNFIAEGKDGFTSFKNCVVIKKASGTPAELLLNTIKDLKIINDDNLVIEKL